MQNEAKFRASLESIWSSGDSPFRKARLLLSEAKRAREAASHMLRMGCLAQGVGQEDKARSCLAESATLKRMADRARGYAAAALRGLNQPMEFDTAPRVYAVPAWERPKTG